MTRYRACLMLLIALLSTTIYAYAQQDTLKPSCPDIYGDNFLDGFTFPQQAVDNCIRGYNVMRFMVDTTGHISDISVVKGTSTVLDDNSAKVLRSSDSKWIPATINGRPVSMYTTHTFLYYMYEYMGSKTYGNRNKEGHSYCYNDTCEVHTLASSGCTHTANYYYNEGVKLYQQGHTKDAQHLFERSVMMNYNDVHALYNLAVVYVTTGNEANACPLLERIKRSGERNVDDMLQKFCTKH